MTARHATTGRSLTWTLSSEPRIAALQVLVVSVALVSPWAGLFDPHAFQIAFFVAALAALAASVLDPQVSSRSLLTRAANPTAILVTAFLVYVALESARYHAPGLAIVDHFIRPLMIFGLAVTLGCMGLYRAELKTLPAAELFTTGIIATAVLLAAMQAYQYAVASFVPAEHAGSVSRVIREINRYLSVLSVFIFLIPAARGGRIGLFLLIGIPFYVLTFAVVGYVPQIRMMLNVPSDTVQIGMPLALLVFVFARWLPHLATRLVFLGIGGLIALAPWFFTYLYFYAPTLVPVRQHLIMDRVEIWYGTARRVLDDTVYNFLFGHGREFLRVDGNFQVPGTFTDVMPFHPHNMILQLWVDLGAVGALFVLAFLWRFYRLVGRSSLAQRPALLASLSMMTLVALVTHSLWQTWLLSGLFLALMLMTLLIEAERPAGETVSG